MVDHREVHNSVKTAIVAIDETAWVDIDHTVGGQAQSPKIRAMPSMCRSVTLT